MKANNSSGAAVWGARVAGSAAAAIGVYWLAAWLSGAAWRWETGPTILVTTNMAIGMVLAGAALMLGTAELRGARRGVAVAAAFVLVIGALTLSEHLFGVDLGIDQLVATEAAGAAGTTSPNRMGVPGSLSLVLLGAGLLARRRRGLGAYCGAAVCLVNLVPLVGYVYQIGEFYREARVTAIAWPTVVALMCLGTGLMLEAGELGPLAALTRRDAGGRLFRQWLPVVVLVPLTLGFLWVQGHRLGLYETAAGIGALVLVLVVSFTALLWLSAVRVSRSARAQAAAEREARESERRAKVAEAVEAERRRLYDVLNMLPAYVVLLSAEHEVPFANRFFEQRFGKSEGRRCFEYLFGRPEACENCESFKALKTGAAHQWEWRGPDGRDYEIHDLPFTDSDGAQMVLEMGIDITERKRAEAALKESREGLERRVGERTAELRESEGRLRAILEQAPCGITIREVPSGKMLLSNEQATQLLGRTASSFDEVASYGAVHPDGRRYRLEEYPLVRAAERGERVRGEEFRFQRADGRWLTLNVSAAPIRGDGGRIIAAATVFDDITERKRAEEALRESEEQLRLAALAGNIGMWSWKPGTSQVVVGGHWRKLFGVAAEAVVTFETWRDALHPEDRERAVRELTEASEQRREFRTEYRVVRPDGTPRWIIDRGHAWYDEQGRPTKMAGVNVDITEQKEAQQVLARSKEELERLVAERTAKLEEMVGELEHFSYSITHDMRAPLRAMKGFGELVGELCAGCERQEPKGFVRRIMVSADRMDALIRDALNYNRAVRQELKLAPVDLGALLRGMVGSYPEWEAARARIEIDGEIPPVMGNEAGLTQCFSNLLGNAVRFVKPGQRPEIRIWAELVESGKLRVDRPSGSKPFGYQPSTLDSQSSTGRVRIWVEDQGIGVPKMMVPRVFDMFSRGHSTHEGTGIGLALVRKVVQRMGGRVGVESQEGKGSRFWVELRAANASVEG